MKNQELANRASEYVVECRENKALSNNTILAYEQDLTCFHRFCAASFEETELEGECILSYLRHLRNVRKLQPATVRRRMLTVRSFASWLYRRRFIPEFAFADIELELKLPKRLPRPIDHGTLSALLGSAGKEVSRKTAIESLPTNPQYSTLLAMNLLIATGVRIGELTHIRLGDISDEGRRIRIRGKGNKERTVYVGNQKLREALQGFVRERQKLAAESDFLFLNRNLKRLTEQAFRIRLRRLSSGLGIAPHVTPHRFRHSAATLLIEEGIDIRIVQRLLGHSSISTTEIYTHVSDASLMAALQTADPLGKLRPEFT